MNILITSVGRRTYLIDYFKAALGAYGRVYAANSCQTYSMSHADGGIITPQIYDDGYVEFLINYCRNNDISAIVSVFDIDLPILAKNKQTFAKHGITVVVSDENVINICNDKWRTYQFLISHGIATPKTFLTIESVKSAIASGALSYPVIMKPRWGMGSIGIYKVDNDDELSVLHSKLQREIFQTYLKYESSEAKDNCIIFQEMIKGQEYGLDVFNDLYGNLVTIVAKKKIAMRAGETDIAEIVDPGIFSKTGVALSKGLHHICNLDADCFLDSDGRVYVLELNCRFGGQYPFSHLAGVNFPRQILQWLAGENTDPTNITPQIGTVCCKDLVPVKMS